VLTIDYDNSPPEEKRSSVGFWLLTGFFGLVGVAVLCWGVFVIGFLVVSYPTNRNMARGQHHIPLIEAALAKDGRFAGVTLSTFKGFGGSIFVQAIVNTPEEKEALLQLVMQTNPPVRVVDHIDVVAAISTRPATGPSSGPLGQVPGN
jgi:hypothetical protein